MILMIDNYDSFTYNLYQQIGTLCPDIAVVRNDALAISEIESLAPQAIIVSPGPGYPKDAGICVEVIRHFATKLPILGVCLGEQSIGEAFGATVVPAAAPLHGKMTNIRLSDSPLFATLPRDIPAGRYHSLIVRRDGLPDALEVIAEDDIGQIMALHVRETEVYGIQFHPESILTECGTQIIKNFLCIAGLLTKEEPVVELPKTELKPFLAKAADGMTLTEAEAFAAMDLIMSGRATDAQIAAFLTALRMRGETIEEITGFARAMRGRAKTVEGHTDAVDIVGTGGDLVGTFNISTTSAFVIAGAGQKVAKHGNRATSSKSGAADCLESLGLRLASTPEQAATLLDDCGISFLFAPSYHSSMRFAAPARRETGLRTVFNILGPLCNPAAAEYILMGCYDGALLRPLAEVLRNLGVRGAMLVHACDGLDEITISGKTNICELRGGEIRTYDLDPTDYGIQLAPMASVLGGTPMENAAVTRAILHGTASDAQRDIVLLNAGCTLYITGKAASIADGIYLARTSIESGAAEQKLDDLIRASSATDV